MKRKNFIRTKTGFLLICSLILTGAILPAVAQQSEAVSRNIEQLIRNRVCVACDLHAANLAGRDLSGVNLEAADLRGANLQAANLRGANLSRAILLGANITDSQLSGVDLRMADLSDLYIENAFKSENIIGTRFEGARFADGVVCGPPPSKGGRGCQHP